MSYLVWEYKSLTLKKAKQIANLIIHFDESGNELKEFKKRNILDHISKFPKFKLSKPDSRVAEVMQEIYQNAGVEHKRYTDFEKLENKLKIIQRYLDENTGKEKIIEKWTSEFERLISRLELDNEYQKAMETSKYLVYLDYGKELRFFAGDIIKIQGEVIKLSQYIWNHPDHRVCRVTGHKIKKNGDGFLKPVTEFIVNDQYFEAELMIESPNRKLLEIMNEGV